MRKVKIATNNIENMLDKMLHEEEVAKEQTRLVKKMSHDEGMSALDRGYLSEEELKTERDEAFAKVQRFSPNWYR